jgi:hypothetical protein
MFTKPRRPPRAAPGLRREAARSPPAGRPSPRARLAAPAPPPCLRGPWESTLYRVLADALMPLPPRSRLRKLMVARRVWRACAAANRRDFRLGLVGWDPASKYRPSSDLMPPRPGNGLPRPRRVPPALAILARCIRGHPVGARGDPRLGRRASGHRSTDGTRIQQRRVHKRAGLSALQPPARFGGPAAGLPGSRERPRKSGRAHSSS